jgi:excinuclease ABC subunit A
VESLSAYARQFLEKLPRPDVESIEGLSPAIAIEQRGLTANPRSTVGTVTEIADYLRVLFANVGVAHCPRSGRPLRAFTVQEIVDQLLTRDDGSRFLLLAPLGRALEGDLSFELGELKRQGFIRARIDGQYVELDSAVMVNAAARHSLEAVIDRLQVRPGLRQRLTDSVELALKLGQGTLLVDDMSGTPPAVLSERLVSWEYDITLPSLEPRLFSFNSPHGACPACGGLGVVQSPDAAQPASRRERPAKDEAEEAEAADEIDEESWQSDERGAASSPQVCSTCQGSRLRPEVQFVRVAGHSYPELSRLSLVLLASTLGTIAQTLEGSAQAIAAPLLKSIASRVDFLLSVGLGYLSLERSTKTLSGGEGQRIRLATQIGSALVGVLYVLDEPSAGLHPRDTQKLVSALRGLVDKGNTVIVVEHDRDVILAADHVLDLGPGAGEHGGQLVASGSPAELMRDPNSVTGPYLTRQEHIGNAASFTASAYLEVIGAHAHNLKNISVSIPLGAFTAVTGVSGSGKSTLVMDTLLRAARQSAAGKKSISGPFKELRGFQAIHKVIGITQAPIGRTPRSNPATYSGILAQLRELYAALPEARARGYKAGRFSFNIKGGRCEKCRGDGALRVEMHFLPDMYVPCDACAGKRYNRETLEILYRGVNIADALNQTVDEASALFVAIPKVAEKLSALRQLGLGYLRLGQAATTLSGGEAQRLKLAAELSRPAADHTLYILDEPTNGLHFSDVEMLLNALRLLRDAGHTVVVVEHHPTLIACADWVVDLGPEAGDKGGTVVVSGTPQEVSACELSHTGRFLRPLLEAAAAPTTRAKKTKPRGRREALS